jgi:hypothetical protein
MDLIRLEMQIYSIRHIRQHTGGQIKRRSIGRIRFSSKL